MHTCRAVTNAAGQVLVPVVVSAREKTLDPGAFRSASASPVDDHAAREAGQEATLPVAA
ncbi:hypothetical protein [Streptomyces sp. NPDC090053]|uniref:hypothetical protein n=1 Tax=unclassified Streptomyces TaxID=2593676 RepID=UPI0038306546